MAELRFEYYDVVTSTNDIVKSRALCGEPEGLVVVARSQTAGKGRMGRTFVSNADSGLYMSMLLRPEITPKELMLLTAMAACETSAAIYRITGVRTSIKWVNDLIFNNKKVCGILVETGFAGEKLGYVAVGIGINLIDNGISDIIDGAGALECDTKLADALACEVTRGVMQGSKKLQSAYFIDDYRQNSCVIGKNINVIKNGVTTPALAAGITDDAFLEVRYGDGTGEILSSFEISIRNI